MRLSAACVCVCVEERERGRCVHTYFLCLRWTPCKCAHNDLDSFCAWASRLHIQTHTRRIRSCAHALPPSPHRAVFMLIGCHGNHTHTHTRHCVRNVFQPSTSHRVVRRVASRLDGCANSEQKRSEARDDDDNNVVCVCVGESYDV